MMEFDQTNPARTPKKRERSYCTSKSFCLKFWPIKLVLISLTRSAAEVELCNKVVPGNMATGVSRVAEPALAAVKKLDVISRNWPATLKLRKRKVSTSRSLSLMCTVPDTSADDEF